MRRSVNAPWSSLHQPGSLPSAAAVPPMRLLTAIPVHNEEKYLEDVLREVARHAEISWLSMMARPTRRPSCSAALPRSKVHPAPTQPGLRSRTRTAFRHTIEAGYDGLVTLDCDGQHEPALDSRAGARRSRMPTSSRAAVIFGSSIPTRDLPRSAGGSTSRSRAGSTNAWG